MFCWRKQEVSEPSQLSCLHHLLAGVLPAFLFLDFTQKLEWQMREFVEFRVSADVVAQ